MKRKILVDENVERCRKARKRLSSRFTTVKEFGEFLEAEDKKRTASATARRPKRQSVAVKPNARRKQAKHS